MELGLLIEKLTKEVIDLRIEVKTLKEELEAIQPKGCENLDEYLEWLESDEAEQLADAYNSYIN